MLLVSLYGPARQGREFIDETCHKLVHLGSLIDMPCVSRCRHAASWGQSNSMIRRASASRSIELCSVPDVYPAKLG